ncbi:ribosomal protein L18ae [Gonapodya prolifera JEL478]|uniref:Ribosomal protein L18ae n=1 Tax=Gonapodya prolifera (strain JEL478) TaxID=1344416 RepID=A0A139A561_GONPJ|nr:ribosomal protein L18ae [Gonapodya prolifera JEL478]|eukprot:KXS11635.1 ribosomal protein L18ae [Gonapodya prolifera JEL478]
MLLDGSLMRVLKEYQVIGRHKPTDNEPTPRLYRMRIFAPNEVVAKSRFWYFIKKLKRVKKANGQIVSVNEVGITAHNYGRIRFGQRARGSRGALLGSVSLTRLCFQIFEKKPTTVKNYGVWLRYDSRSGTHNMYKEYRELNRADAVSSCYQDMAARHRARFSSIQIIRVATVKTADLRRAYTQQLAEPNLKFPLPHRIIRPESKRHTKVFVGKRPSTFY